MRCQHPDIQYKTEALPGIFYLIIRHIFLCVCPLIFNFNYYFNFFVYIVQDEHLFSLLLTLQMSTHNFPSLQLYSPMSAFKIWHSLNLYKIWPPQTTTDRQTNHPTYQTTEAPPELKKGILPWQLFGYKLSLSKKFFIQNLLYSVN